MHRARARRGEAAHERGGVAGLGDDAVEVALLEPRRRVAEDVDGGNHLYVPSHHANMPTRDGGTAEPRHSWQTTETTRALRGDPLAADGRRRRRRSSGTCARCRSWRRWRTAGRWRGWWTRGCRTRRSRANGRLDDDGDARGALAAPRRGRLSAGARPHGAAQRSDRLTIAVPAKGRLREPAVALLDDAGLGPEQPGERALAFPCRNAPVDVLLVRAADIPEYVQDGVVDCGITGADLVRERGAEVEELLRLGFGSLHARGGRARGVAARVARRPRRAARRDRLPAARAASCWPSAASTSSSSR